MFKGKPTKVIVVGGAKEEFDDLNKIVGTRLLRELQAAIIRHYSTP